MIRQRDGRQGGSAASVRASAALRIGYAAHGAVYLLVGAFAIDAAVSGGKRAQGSQEAVAWLGRGVWGDVLLTALAAGLFTYSGLRFWQAIAGRGRASSGAKRWLESIGAALSGLAQAALALYALSIAYGLFLDSSSDTTDLTARLMSLPGGRWIVGAVGIGMCAMAIAQIASAIQARFVRDLRISERQCAWVEPLGRAAFAARFVVFMLVGWFIILAAVRANPSEAQGLGGALRALQDQPYGPWLLALVGAGLMAFAALRGVYVRYAVLPKRD